MSELKNYNDPPPEPYSEPKQRHGCLSVWLYFMIAGNVLSMLLNFFQINEIAQKLNVSQILVFVLVLLGGVNILAAVLILNWKKLGFYLAAVSSITIFVMNLVVGISILQALFGFVGLAALFGALQIGGEYNKGWPQLE